MHGDGKGDLSMYGREECHHSGVVRGEDTGTGGEATAHKVISTPATRVAGRSKVAGAARPRAAHSSNSHLSPLHHGQEVPH